MSVTRSRGAAATPSRAEYGSDYIVEILRALGIDPQAK